MPTDPPPPGSIRSPDARSGALAALVTVQLLFATLPVVGKLAIPALGAQGVVATRVIGGALAFHALRAALRVPPLPRALQTRAMLLSVLGISANQGLYMAGLARTSATHAALITTTIPLLTPLAAVALGRERLGRRQAAGTLLAGAGVAILVLSRDPSGVATLGGDLLVLANASVYALYLVLSRDTMAQAHPLSMLPWLFTWGAVPVVLLGGLPALADQPAATLGAAAWLVLGPTVGTYWLNLYALRTLPASTVAVFIYLQPVAASALAAAALGEAFTLPMAISTAVTFAGLWLTRR